MKFTPGRKLHLLLESSSDPPIFLVDAEMGVDFDKNVYKEYTKQGSKVDYNVFPAMFVGEKMVLLHKGVIRPKDN